MHDAALGPDSTHVAEKMFCVQDMQSGAKRHADCHARLYGALGFCCVVLVLLDGYYRQQQPGNNRDITCVKVGRRVKAGK